MKIPNSVVIIGQAHSMTYRTQIPYPMGSMPLYRSFENHLIATNNSNTTIFIFPNITSGEKKIVSDRSGIQRGFIHTSMRYEVPTVELKKIGIVESIQYSSNWWEGKMNRYEHTFTEHPALYADKNTRFRVIGMKPRHTKILSQSGIIT